MNRTITVYAEATPNPSTMKFVTDVMLMNGGESAEFLSLEDSKGYSSMAEALFAFPFVKSVFFANNFVTITKTEAIQWDFVMNELREFVKDWVEKNDTIVEKLPESKSLTSGEGEKEKIISVEPELNTETDRLIHGLLEEYVKPAVESDGGAIDFKSFDEVTGIVTVVLRGSCSGCPSSTATLKGGIESLLKTQCPEVSEVVALEG